MWQLVYPMLAPLPSKRCLNKNLVLLLKLKKYWCYGWNYIVFLKNDYK